MAKNDVLYAFLLLLGAAALANSLKPRCPVCKNEVEPLSLNCRICGSALRWKP